MQEFHYVACVVTAKDLTGAAETFLAEEGEEPSGSEVVSSQPAVTARVKMAAWGERWRKAGVTWHPPLGRGIKWTGMDLQPFSESMWSEVLSLGRLETQVPLVAHSMACNLGRLFSRLGSIVFVCGIEPESLWVLTSTRYGSI